MCTCSLFDVPFDRSQSALPGPVFNNSGGSNALQHSTPGMLVACHSFGDADWQALIRGV